MTILLPILVSIYFLYEAPACQCNPLRYRSLLYSNCCKRYFIIFIYFLTYLIIELPFHLILLAIIFPFGYLYYIFQILVVMPVVLFHWCCRSKNRKVKTTMDSRILEHKSKSRSNTLRKFKESIHYSDSLLDNENQYVFREDEDLPEMEEFNNEESSYFDA